MPARPMILCRPLVALGVLLVAAYGCNEAPPESRGAAAPGTGSSIHPTQPAQTFHIEGESSGREFSGLAGVIGGEGEIHLFWKRPSHPLTAYRIYTATRSGDHDFSRPTGEVQPTAIVGDFEVFTLDPVPLGTTLYSIVRAVDASGKEDDNEVEWGATSNPVFRVDPTAKDDDRAKPVFSDIEAAIGKAIALDGANIYVIDNTLQERVYLFDGIHLYGGFDSTFHPTARMISGSRTRLVGQAGLDTLVVAPGDLLCTVDGFELVGRLPSPQANELDRASERGRRGVVAEDCNLQLAHLFVHGFRDKGIELRSADDLDDDFKGNLYECEIAENVGEGLAVSGVFDVVVRNCILRDNGEEGLEIEPLSFSSEEKCSIELDRCEISSNRDLGLNLTVTAHQQQGRGTGATVRIRMSRSRFESNEDHGASIDVQADTSDRVDLRLSVTDCRFAANGQSGLEIDADIEANYGVFNCSFSQNQRSGISLSGDAPNALIRVAGSTFEDQNPDVEVRSPVTVLVESSVTPSRSNSGPGTLLSGSDYFRIATDDAKPFRRRSVPRQDLLWIHPPAQQPVGPDGWRIRFRSLKHAIPRIDLLVDGKPIAYQSRVESKDLIVVPTEPLPRTDACSLVISIPTGADSVQYSLPYPIQLASEQGFRFPTRKELRFDRNGQSQSLRLAETRPGTVRLQWAVGSEGHLITRLFDDGPIPLKVSGWKDREISRDFPLPRTVDFKVEGIPEHAFPYRVIFSLIPE